VSFVALPSGITLSSPAQIADAVAAASQVGLPVFELSTGDRAEGEAFFDAVRAVLPLDPPLQRNRSWDALADSLWEGIRLLDPDTVLITWPDAWQFQAANPKDYAIAATILGDLTESLRDPVSTAGRPKAVSVFLGTP